MILGNNSVAPEDAGVKRQIGSYSNNLPGPTLLFICGLHGNEPSGVLAFLRVIDRLNNKKPQLHGTLVGLAGNLVALEKKVRFIDRDLNRSWTNERIQGLRDGTIGHSWHLSENAEQKDLMDHMEEIFSQSRGPIYVFDLHSTSSDSKAFISINDTIRNRTFAQHFPFPIILGIEEHLDGTALNYINQLGYIAIGIEGGQHEDPAAVDRHESAIWLALEKAGSIEPSIVPIQARKWLNEKQTQANKIFEVRYRHAVQKNQAFKMNLGFQNFQLIRKNDPLATSDQGVVRAPETGKMFMPLYQKQGDDGFFIVRQIKPFWLAVSKWLRKMNVHKLFAHFPGIAKHEGKDYELVVNTNIARWYVIELFHLMGFRRKEKGENKIIFRRRQYDFKGPEKDQP